MACDTDPLTLRRKTDHTIARFLGILLLLGCSAGRYGSNLHFHQKISFTLNSCKDTSVTVVLYDTVEIGFRNRLAGGGYILGPDSNAVDPHLLQLTHLTGKKRYEGSEAVVNLFAAIPLATGIVILPVALKRPWEVNTLQHCRIRIQVVPER